jgi:FlaA1/EpsC-like NDP-sugar epimerase
MTLSNRSNPADEAATDMAFSNRSILVTGGTGSFGNAFITYGQS